MFFRKGLIPSAKHRQNENTRQRATRLLLLACILAMAALAFWWNAEHRLRNIAGETTPPATAPQQPDSPVQDETNTLSPPQLAALAAMGASVLWIATRRFRKTNM